MNGVSRLIAHDLRVHGVLFAMWGAIVVAHPLAAALPWGDDAVAFGWMLAAALVAARILLTVMLVATLVQSDSPIDDRAFWRTTPIPPATMATVKLTIAVAVFVGLPLVVVLCVALALGVPVSHWPIVATGVVLSETPLVLLSVIAAAMTRRTSNAVVAVVSAVVVLIVVEALLLDTTARYRSWLKLAGAPANGPWMAAWVGFCLLVGASVVWWRRLSRPAVAFGGAAVIIGLFLPWLVPATRAIAPQAAHVQPRPSLLRLEVRRQRGALRLGVAIAHQYGDVARVSMKDVALSVGNERHQLPDAISMWPSQFGPERVVQLLDLSESAAARSQGAPVVIDGYVVGTTLRRRVFARVPLAPGARFTEPSAVGVVDRVYQPTEDAPTMADVDVLFLRGTGIAFESLVWDARVSIAGDEQYRQVVAQRDAREELASFLRLPILARPFEYRRLSLRAPVALFNRSIGTHADLEFAEPELDTRIAPVAATLVMPPVPQVSR